MENYSYITVLSTEKYLEGLLCLVESLKNSNTKYLISILITDNITIKTEKILRDFGLNVIRRNRIKVPDIIQAKNQKGIFDQWNNTFDKLQIFELTEFEKLIYLDSDMYILKNIDELFKMANMSATVDRPTGPVRSKDYEMKMTSGLMVIKPKEGLTKEFMNILMNSGIENKRQLIGDQDILQEYDPEWKNKNELHLPDGYNMFYPHLDYFVNYLGLAISDIKVVHFILKEKPFYYEKVEEYLQYIETNRLKTYQAHRDLFEHDYVGCPNTCGESIAKDYFKLLKTVRGKLSEIT